MLPCGIAVLGSVVKSLTFKGIITAKAYLQQRTTSTRRTTVTELEAVRDNVEAIGSSMAK
jgi:hypothetical protein